MSEILNKYCLHSLISSRASKIVNSNFVSKEDLQYIPTPRFKLENMPEDFLNNDVWKSAIRIIIARLETMQESQYFNDSMHEDFCTVLKKEIDMVK